MSLALLAPITNRAKGYPFEVPIPLGADVTGVVLADQVKSLDWRARRAEHLCSLEDRVARAVIQRIQRLLE